MRINIFVPDELHARIELAEIPNVSRVCQAALAAACAAVETQREQTVTLRMTRRVTTSLEVVEETS